MGKSLLGSRTRSPTISQTIGFLAVFSFAFQMEVKAYSRGFQARAAQAQRSVSLGMQEALRASRLLIQVFVSFEKVTRQAFGSFAMLLKKQVPYVDLLACLRSVGHANRPAYERARRTVLPGGYIGDEHSGRRTMASAQPGYQVINYAVPAQMMGIDASGQLQGDQVLARDARRIFLRQYRRGRLGRY